MKCAVVACTKPSRARSFCVSHYLRFMKYGDPIAGRLKLRANGRGTVMPSGYVYLTVHGKQVRQHRLIVEKILGKRLPPQSVIHHVDHDRTNNDPSNLVVCPDSSYHQLLHTREKALNACGNADWRKCNYCKKWDAPENLTIRTRNQYHRLCNNAGIYYKESA